MSAIGELGGQVLIVGVYSIMLLVLLVVVGVKVHKEFQQLGGSKEGQCYRHYDIGACCTLSIFPEHKCI